MKKKYIIIGIILLATLTIVSVLIMNTIKKESTINDNQVMDDFLQEENKPKQYESDEIVIDFVDEDASSELNDVTNEKPISQIEEINVSEEAKEKVVEEQPKDYDRDLDETPIIAD